MKTETLSTRMRVAFDGAEAYCASQIGGWPAAQAAGRGSGPGGRGGGGKKGKGKGKAK